MTDDLHDRVLEHLEAHPDATQRDLAKALGISLGSTNDCVRALIDQGWMKVQNFRKSNHKPRPRRFRPVKRGSGRKQIDGLPAVDPGSMSGAV